MLNLYNHLQYNVHDSLWLQIAIFAFKIDHYD